MHSGLANTLRTSLVKLSGWKIPSHKVLMKLSVDQRIIKSIQDDLKDPWVEIRMDLQDLFGKACLFWPFFFHFILRLLKVCFVWFRLEEDSSYWDCYTDGPLKFSSINWLIRAGHQIAERKAIADFLALFLSALHLHLKPYWWSRFE